MYLNNLLVKTTKGVGTGPKGIGKCAFRGIWRPITSKKHEKQVEHGLEKIKSTEVVGGKEGEVDRRFYMGLARQLCVASVRKAFKVDFQQYFKGRYGKATYQQYCYHYYYNGGEEILQSAIKNFNQQKGNKKRFGMIELFFIRLLRFLPKKMSESLLKVVSRRYGFEELRSMARAQHRHRLFNNHNGFFTQRSDIWNLGMRIKGEINNGLFLINAVRKYGIYSKESIKRIHYRMGIRESKILRRTYMLLRDLKALKSKGNERWQQYGLRMSEYKGFDKERFDRTYKSGMYINMCGGLSEILRIVIGGDLGTKDTVAKRYLHSGNQVERVNNSSEEAIKHYLKKGFEPATKVQHSKVILEARNTPKPRKQYRVKRRVPAAAQVPKRSDKLYLSDGVDVPKDKIVLSIQLVVKEQKKEQQNVDMDAFFDGFENQIHLRILQIKRVVEVLYTRGIDIGLITFKESLNIVFKNPSQVPDTKAAATLLVESGIDIDLLGGVLLDPLSNNPNPNSNPFTSTTNTSDLCFNTSDMEDFDTDQNSSALYRSVESDYCSSLTSSVPDVATPALDSAELNNFISLVDRGCSKSPAFVPYRPNALALFC